MTLDQAEDGGLEVRWTAASDDVQVAGYRVFRDGGLLGTVGGSTLTFVDTDDLCEGSYLYEVVAFDGAGNESEPGRVRPTSCVGPRTLVGGPCVDGDRTLSQEGVACMPLPTLGPRC